MSRTIKVCLVVLTLASLSGCSRTRTENHSSPLDNMPSTPLSDPVSQPLAPDTESQEVYLTEEELASYITDLGGGIDRLVYDMLPGFSIDIPDDWQVRLKPYGQSIVTRSDGYHMLGSMEEKINIAVSKQDVGLVLDFLLVWDDDIGIRCSDNAPYSSIGTGWYRFRDSTGIYYTHYGYENYFTGDQWSLYSGNYTQDWQYELNTRYQFCLDKSGISFLSRPPAELSTDDNGILMLNPLVVGDPAAEDLETMDAIVRSIQNECVTDTCVFTAW